MQMDNRYVGEAVPVDRNPQGARNNIVYGLYRDIVDRLNRAQVLFPIAVWGISRFVIFIWAIVATRILPVRQLTIVGDVPALPATGLNLLIEPWARWDTLWYLRIATRGYAVGDLTGGFFPLYPLAIRALTWILPNALFNALVISNLAALGAFIVFYRVAQTLYDEPTAQRALIYWAAFQPASIFSPAMPRRFSCLLPF